MAQSQHPSARAFVWIATGAIVACFVSPARTFAQSERPRLTVSLGAGQVRPLASFSPVKSAAWSTGLQYDVNRHLTFGASVSWWHHALPPLQAEVFDIDGIFRTVTTRAMSMFDWSAEMIASGTIHRLRLTSGVAAGFSTLSLDYGESVNCGPERPCQTFRDSAHVTVVAGLLGFDVRLTRRISGYLTCRLTLPTAGGFASVSYVGGLRVGLR